MFDLLWKEQQPFHAPYAEGLSVSWVMNYTYGDFKQALSLHGISLTEGDDRWLGPT